MSYREKSAWLALIAMGVAYGPYFILGLLAPAGEKLPDLRQLGVFATVSVARMLILGIGSLVLRRAAPEEASAPPDERDRAITSRGTSAAYYILIVGMIVVGCVMPFTAAGWTIVNAALFMIVAAEVVSYAIAVVSYRRQAA